MNTTPNVAEYDYLLVSESGGKDSQAMLTHVVELADRLGVDRSRIVVVHADLGTMEWQGTAELARAHAEAYGLRFETVGRSDDLLTQVENRHARLQQQADALDAEGRHEDAEVKRNAPAWFSPTNRYCTSDNKRDQIAKLLTQLAAERRATGATGPARILDCQGIRKEEGADRAKKTPFQNNKRATNGRRVVDTWFPIFEWTKADVWRTIRRSGLPYHPAYDAGMPRLSCCFCMMAGRRELVLAARLNPGLAARYVATEAKVGATFKADLSMADVLRQAQAEGPLALPAAQPA